MSDLPFPRSFTEAQAQQLRDDIAGQFEGTVLSRYRRGMPQLERTPIAQHEFDRVVTPDPFDDDTPIVASCDLSNPESCESCQ